MEPAKATTGTPPRLPDLSLYARAQARAAEVEEAYRASCSSCLGPGSAGGCEGRKRVPVAGISAWPDCPLAMIRTPAWQDLVTAYLLEKAAPGACAQRQLVAWAHDALVELHVAVRVEEDRQMEAARSRSGGPKFTGRAVPHGSGRRSA